MEEANKDNIVEMVNNRFGELIEILKERHGYSYQEISDKTNLSPSFIFRIIKGYRGCELTTKLNILLNCFGLEEEVKQYLERVVSNKEELKKISD